MVVEQRHDTTRPEGVDDGPKDVLGRGVGREGVLGDDLVKHAGRVGGRGATGGRRSSERGLHAEAWVQGMVDRVGQTHAVEALGLHNVGDVVDRLLVQALGDVGFAVAGPVDALELDARAIVVEDPAAGAVEGECGLGGSCGGEGKADGRKGGEGPERDHGGAVKRASRDEVKT